MGDRRATDIMDSERFSVEELRATIFEEEGSLSRPLALSLLGRKTYPKKVDDLRRLLVNEEEVPRLRNMAAQLLGQVDSPDATRILEQGLGVTDDLALRGVIEALAKSRSEEARSSLEELSRRGGSVGEAAKGVARLLGYRLGTPESDIVPLEALRLLRVDPAEAVPIELEAAPSEDAGVALEHVLRMAPALKLTTQGATIIRCEGRSLLYLFDEDLAAAGPARLGRTKAEIGVIAGPKEREGYGWEVKYDVLAAPREDGEIAIVLTTSRGRPIFAGTGRLIQERVEFEIRSIEGVGALPVEVRGTYDGRTLAFIEARSGTRRQSSPTPPTSSS
jgi:hypothetical protein